MPRVNITFVLPKKDGWETPFGEKVVHAFDDQEPVAALFARLKQHISATHVRLSTERPMGSQVALDELDPSDTRTIVDAGLAGTRVIVGLH